MTEHRIHESAAAGFQSAADVYERGRPEYSREAVERLADELAIGPGRRVLDLAAGTGKLTEALLPTGATFVAVEPVAAMRSVFERKLPNIKVVNATAESISLPNASIDAVVVGQAFHWFDGQAALSEIHRVLRPGGGLGLVWQAREPSRPWIVRLDSIIDREDKGNPRYRTGEWRIAFDHSPLFEPLLSAEYSHVEACTHDVIVDRVASISYIASLPKVALDALRAEVWDLLASDPGTRGRDTVDLPYITSVYWTHSRS